MQVLNQNPLVFLLPCVSFSSAFVTFFLDVDAFFEVAAAKMVDVPVMVVVVVLICLALLIQAKHST
jgi:hypothetical protein